MQLKLCPAPAASHVAEIILHSAACDKLAAIILQLLNACSATTASHQPGRRPRGPHVFMQKQHQHTVHTACMMCAHSSVSICLACTTYACLHCLHYCSYH